MKLSEKDLDLLISKLKSSEISSLEYQEGDFSIALKNEQSEINHFDTSLNSNNFEIQTTSEELNDIVEKIEQSSEQCVEFLSPLIGNFYLTKDPSSPALSSVGDVIKEGDVLCVIEAMKMISEVKAEKSGTIKEICVEPGSFVDLDTVLFKISEE